MKINLYLLISVIIVVIFSVPMLMADDHRENKRLRAPTLPAVSNALYANACSACHFAYQPGWLPARSWLSMMDNLDNHFGENAELTTPAQVAIRQYLLNNAADKVTNRKSEKILNSISSSAAPLSIANLPYIQKKHRKISSRMISQNAQVRALSNCVACHTQAEQGYFDEHGVVIPNYGPWEDD